MLVQRASRQSGKNHCTQQGHHNQIKPERFKRDPSEGTLIHRPGSEYNCTGYDQDGRSVLTYPHNQFVRLDDGRVERQEEDDEENRQEG